MSSPEIIAVTPGDPDGIGPEVVWKTIQKLSPDTAATLLCVGARAPFDRLGALVIDANESLVPTKQSKPYVWLLPAPEKAPRGKFLPGYQSGWAIETATRMVRQGKARALVTGPISKERLQRGGFRYPGHTEFLADLCRKGRKVPEVTMMLANDQLRITLVTTHISLAQVPRALTRPKIRRAILQTVEHLQKWWGIRRPRVAIAALNPHAGENGMFGKEEIKVIAPEVQSLQKAARDKFELHGPLPADTLFANHIMGKHSGNHYDAVVCMYHDQGLIPVKLLDFPRTVNITLGLPMIRTSVDHGVGFDIAGQDKADPSSFHAAVNLALKLRK